jgi:hypothetical protein
MYFVVSNIRTYMYNNRVIPIFGSRNRCLALTASHVSAHILLESSICFVHPQIFSPPPLCAMSRALFSAVLPRLHPSNGVHRLTALPVRRNLFTFAQVRPRTGLQHSFGPPSVALGRHQLPNTYAFFHLTRRREGMPLIPLFASILKVRS